MTTNKYIKYFWIAIIIIIILIILLYISIKDNKIINNINELYKIEIKNKQRVIDSLDKVYIKIKIENDKLIREREDISYKKDLKEIEKNKKKIEDIGTKKPTHDSNDSPEELLEFLNNIVKKHL
jgi:cell shape-determining protein MreC